MNAVPAAVVAGLAVLMFPSPQDPQPAGAGAAPPATAAPLKADRAMLERLSWLSGTWSLQDGDTTTEEHWRPLQGTMILGTSHSFDAKKTHFFEHLRIALMREQIAYLAMPGGKPPTAFLLTKLEDAIVEFENPKHDHPQRIRYEKTAAGVTATVSLLDGSRAQTFVFKKAN